MSYDILEDTFCIYCQREFASPANLQRHIERKHPDTHASHAVKVAREKAREA